MDFPIIPNKLLLKFSFMHLLHYLFKPDKFSYDSPHILYVLKAVIGALLPVSK
jgi:hypothetical protein